MPKFDVTVSRVGTTTVEAATMDEAMAIANSKPTNDINWADNWDATDAQEQDEPEPIEPIELPLSPYKLTIRPDEKGYAISASRDDETVDILHIIMQSRTYNTTPKPTTIYGLNVAIPVDYDDSNCVRIEDLLTPENRPAVTMLPDGRLWCRKCHCYVPNTANHEMRRDGCYAHSHVCGIKAPDETYVDNDKF